MALSKEDKGDVKRAMGKAMANKIAKVTRDAPRLNAWGQDEKTAREVRKHLRNEKKMKSFMKHASKRFDSGY